MSVIVKGMEMPNSCGNCPLRRSNENRTWCSVIGKYIDFDKEYDGRRSDCPLVEIPTPHGRLIDADKLNIHDVSPVDGFCVMGVTEEDIGLAETVIEAEGET